MLFPNLTSYLSAEVEGEVLVFLVQLWYKVPRLCVSLNNGYLGSEADPDPNQRGGGGGAEIISGGAETISGVGAETISGGAGHI